MKEKETGSFNLLRRFSLDRLVRTSAVLACLATQPIHAADFGSEDCGALSAQTFRGVTVTAADWLVVEPAAGQAVCVVAGHQPPYLDIEVVLPGEWSGRYLQQGGGIIANPAACGFEPQSLSCEVSDADLCLSNAQVGTLELLLSDIVDSSGNVLSSRFYWADFGRLANAFSGLGGVYAVLATGDAAWLQAEKRRQFSPDDHHYLIGNGLMRAGLAHDRIAIAQYVASGRKLISWHAGADDLLTPADHARLFDEMMATAEALAVGSATDVHTNARFFIVPGGNHGAGVHPSVGWIEAIIEWTENGKAPESLTYEQADGSTIPVCRFPAYPRGTSGGYACSDG